MTFPRRIWIGLLLIGTAGCSVQDPTQPPVGSITAGARKESTAPNLPPGKARTGQAGGK